MPQQRTEDARLVSPNGDDIPLYLADPPAQLSTRVKRDLSPKITDSQGVGYQNADERWLVFEQSDWSGGAGADKVRQQYGSETRYASANGVITYRHGEVSPLFACDLYPLGGTAGRSWQAQFGYGRTMIGVDPLLESSVDRLAPLIPITAGLPTAAQLSTPRNIRNLDSDGSRISIAIRHPEDADHSLTSAVVFQDHIVVALNGIGLRAANIAEQWYGPQYGIPDPENPGTPLLRQYYLYDPQTPEPKNQAHVFTGVNADGDHVLIYTDGITYRQANQTDDTIDDVLSPGRTWPDWQFSAPIRVGPSDYTPEVHDMLMFKDRLMVGRSDGLWVYDTDEAKFVNIEPQVGFTNDRFTHMIASGNEIYATYGNSSLVRIVDPLGDAPQFFDITTRIQHAHWRGVTGEIRGLAAWRGYILVVADGYAPETTQLPQDLATNVPLSARFGGGHARLMLYDPSSDTGHILHQFDMDYVHGMIVESLHGYIYVYGLNTTESGEEVVRYRYRPPETQPYPTLIDNPQWTFPDGATVDGDHPAYYGDGWVTTPWIDHSYVDDTKTLDHVRCVYQTQSEAGGIKVEYRVEKPGELLEGSSDFVGESQEFVNNAESFYNDVTEFHEEVSEFVEDVKQRAASLTGLTNDERTELTEQIDEFEDDVHDFDSDVFQFQRNAKKFVEEGGRFASATRKVSSDAPDTHPHSWIPLGVLTRGRQVLRIPQRDERLRYSRIRFRFTLLGMTKLEQVVVVSKLDQKLEREFSLGLSFRDTPNDVRPEKTLRKLEAWRKQREQYRFVPVSNSLAWLDEATVEIVDLEIQTGDAAGIDGSSQRQLGADAILRLEEVDY